MMRSVKNVARLTRISTILAQHDALFFLERFRIAPFITGLGKFFGYRRKANLRPGVRLANALSDLGPTFIKLGQALSIRPDLVGEDIARDLSKLQDKLPAFSKAEARAIIEQELMLPLDQLFSEFNDYPVAAASIAQVHRAVTKEGKDVAVKVLRPNIEAAFFRDVELLLWLAEMAERNLPKLKRLRLIEVVETFAKSSRAEMDLRLEAAASQELKENFKADKRLVVPEIDWNRTSRRVLTSEWVEGINIVDRDALIAAGLEVDEVIKTAAEIFFQQVFRDGFFHADMHPGNVFVDTEGRLIVVDFGIMGRLDSDTQVYLAEMLFAFLSRNYIRVAEVHMKAGYVPSTQSKELFAQASRSIAEPIFGRPQHEISIAKLLAQLFDVAEQFEMQTQPQLLLLQKTMMLMEGIARSLNPDINIWKLAEPMARDWMIRNMSPAAKAKRVAAEFGELRDQVKMFLKATEHIASMATAEGIKIHPETLRQFTQNTGQSQSRWKFVIFSAIISIVSAVTAVIVFKIL